MAMTSQENNDLQPQDRCPGVAAVLPPPEPRWPRRLMIPLLAQMLFVSGGIAFLLTSLDHRNVTDGWFYLGLALAVGAVLLFYGILYRRSWARMALAAETILWLVGGTIGLFMLYLSPAFAEAFGIERDQNTTVPVLAADILDWPGFLSTIREQGKEEKPSPGKKIWSQLSPSLQETLLDLPLKRDPSQNFKKDFLRELCTLLTRGDFYEESAGKNLRLDTTDQTLLDRSKETDLAPTARTRLNRLLLEQAYPNFLEKTFILPPSLAVTVVSGLAGILFLGLLNLILVLTRKPWEINLSQPQGSANGVGE